MLYATNRFPGDGMTTQYEISFVGGYLDRTHVKAYVEGADLVQTPVTLSPGNFIGQYTIGGLATVPVGSTLVIYRDTPKAPIVDFVNGSRFTESNLDTATRQGSFIAAEGADAVSPTGLAGVIQQVVDFSAAAGVARDQAVAAQNTVVASSDASSLSASNANDSALSAAADAAAALNNKNLSVTAAFNAATSATQAQGFLDTASTHAANAANSATAAAASYDSFDDRYLGAKAVAPTTDNDGGALLTGALYWDTALPGMRSWNGSVWVTLPAATKASVGLPNVDDTRDANKPVSTPQQTALNLKADKASPALTGIPTAPTAAAGVNSTQLATTEYALAAAALRYGKNNVLGTVSQAAGVPTGAVIERGANANGAYVRFADGTQICTRTMEAFATVGTYGVTASPFAASFSAAPICSATMAGYITAPDRWTVLAAEGRGTTGCSITVTSSATQASLPVCVTAIGRWF